MMYLDLSVVQSDEREKERTRGIRRRNGVHLLTYLLNYSLWIPRKSDGEGDR